MNFSERQIRILHKKIHKTLCHARQQEFVGYLTPVEILYLEQLGIQRPQNGSMSECYLERAREQVKRGESGGSWFYFIPGKGLMSKLRDNEPKH